MKNIKYILATALVISANSLFAAANTVDQAATITVWEVTNLTISGPLTITTTVPDEVITDAFTSITLISNDAHTLTINVKINNLIDAQAAALKVAVADTFGSGTVTPSFSLTTADQALITGIDPETRAHDNILTYIFDSSGVQAGVYSQIITFTILEET